MANPDVEECYRLLKEFHIPNGVIRHSEQVAKVATTIAQKFKDKGIEIDVELVNRAGLLHDIARPIHFKEFEESDDADFWQDMQEKYPEKRHGEVGYELFKDDYPELAQIILKHAYSDLVVNPPSTWEEKIINYADKRVAHDQIVTLKERLEEGHRRWAHHHPGKSRTAGLDTNKIDEMHFKLEAEIFEKINMKPEELTYG